MIGKRREIENNPTSKRKSVSCTLKLANLSTTVRAEKLRGIILFFGKHMVDPDTYLVLSTQEFEATVETGRSFSKDMEPFGIFPYSGSNLDGEKVGGHRYYGHLLALYDSEGKLILTDTLASDFRAALAADADLLDSVLKYKVSTVVSGNFDILPKRDPY